MSTASALQAFIRPIRTVLAAGASLRGPTPSTSTGKPPVVGTVPKDTPADLETPKESSRPPPSASHLEFFSAYYPEYVPGTIPPNFVLDYSFDSGLYLQRLVSALAGAHIPNRSPEVTLDEVTRAYFHAKQLDKSNIAWQPALVDIHHDATSQNVAKLCYAMLGTLYPAMMRTKTSSKRGSMSRTSHNVDTDLLSGAQRKHLYQLLKETREVTEADQRSRQFSNLSLAPSALSTSSWSSGAPTPAILGVQPHIIALIDGDGYIFNKELLLQGRQGGREAARLLATSIAESFNHRMDYRLSIYLFLNVAGTMGKLVASDLDTQFKFDVLRDFLSGFQAPPFNYVIDPGSGKERVDTKLKELFRVSLRAPDTECVVLGVSHDNGYLATIEGEVLFQSKIKLLNAGPDMVSEGFKNDFPHLPIIKVPELFEWHSYPRESAESRAARKLEREVRSDSDLRKKLGGAKRPENADDTGDGPPRAENFVPAQML
ncbi:hypothetical protein NMY22_g11939 [Coprinellus aureogranulatus]|nr:hypothetical protein NMY22_g11939 [Coprinellus aureogranulatus]